jgi:hypothetical protein
MGSGASNSSSKPTNIQKSSDSNSAVNNKKAIKKTIDNCSSRIENQTVAMQLVSTDILNPVESSKNFHPNTSLPGSQNEQHGLPLVSGESAGQQQQPQVSGISIPFLASDSVGQHGIDRTANEEGNEIEDEMFDQTAMSLGMNREEFLFNLMYFGNGEMPNLNTAISNAREETVALYSEHNTPYKLRPASFSAIESLKSIILTSLDDLDDADCAICKEDMTIGTEVTFPPNCAHCFHKECLIRWIKLVSSYYFCSGYVRNFIIKI